MFDNFDAVLLARIQFAFTISFHLVLILVPIIIVYTAYSYWVFRGKVDAEVGYH